jgi:hypothetical protein
MPKLKYIPESVGFFGLYNSGIAGKRKNSRIAGSLCSKTARRKARRAWASRDIREPVCSIIPVASHRWCFWEDAI